MATAAIAHSPAQRAQAVAAVANLRANFAWWAERCYQILDKRGELRPLRLNYVQRAIEAAEREMLRAKGESRLIILKGRQGGVTTYRQAKSLHTIWSTTGATALTLAHDSDTTAKIFEITKRAVEHFPHSLLPQLGAAQTREISFPGLDSRFYTGTAGAGRTGRGLTVRMLHGSEFFFWDAPRSTLNTVTPALVPDGSSVALESTASGFDSEGHNFWRESAAGGNSYRALFFPWWECDPVNYRLELLEPDELGTLEEDEQLLMAQHGLDLEQVKWRRAKMRDMGRAEFLQEYPEDPESCWLSPGGMFYDVEVLKALMLLAPQPIRTEMGGELTIYDEIPLGDRAAVGPKPERAIIGADTAEGGPDLDRSTFRARSFPSARLLVGYESRTVTPKEFAAILNTWGRRLGMALLVVEKNAHGITVLRHLRDDHKYPIDRIYHRPALDNARQESSAERIGWATTGESQPRLLDAGREIFNAAKEGRIGVPDVSVLRDAFGVRRDQNGKVKLNAKDALVADALAWMGRSAPLGGIFIGRA